MTARRVEEVERRLRELRQEEWSAFALAALSLALALGAARTHAPLAMPFFVGALGVGVLGVGALVRRCELCDRLLLERDAYGVAEVRRRVDHIASMDSRWALARSARTKLTPTPGFALRPRITTAAKELQALARELENDELALDPSCAVLCRLLPATPYRPK